MHISHCKNNSSLCGSFALRHLLTQAPLVAPHFTPRPDSIGVARRSYWHLSNKNGYPRLSLSIQHHYFFSFIPILINNGKTGITVHPWATDKSARISSVQLHR